MLVMRMSKKKTESLTRDEILLAEEFLKVCQSKEELRDWILTFLDIDFPSGFVDPESNSSPIDWMYEAYSYVRDGRKKRTPSVVVYSARECYKTLSMSCYEFVVMCHFGVTVSHMAAIKNQSEKAVSYVTSYLRKCRKYIEYHGRSIDSQAKSHIKITEDEGDESYLKVIVCTMAGANGEHTLIFCLDGSTEILIKNPKDTNRLRVSKNAEYVYGLLESGRKIEAFSLNHETGSYEFKPITRWSRSTEDRVQLNTESGKSVIATSNHEFFVVGYGYKRIDEIKIGDKIVSAGRSKTVNRINTKYSPIKIKEIGPVNASLDQFMMGTLLGGGCVYRKKSNNGLFACTHGLQQARYARWKIDYLNQFYPTKQVKAKSGYTGLPLIGIRTGCNQYFNQWQAFRNTFEGVERLNAFGLALWFQDDGSANSGLIFHTESFTYEQNLRLQCILKSNFDIDVEIRMSKGKYFQLVGGVSELYKVQEICGKFVRPDMKYKFDRLKQSTKNCTVCGNEFHNFDTAPNNMTCYDQICQNVSHGSMITHSVTKMTLLEKDFVYDFTVEGNNNLFANGFLSHNCADELDVVQYPHAFEEAKLIPGPDRGRMPLTVFTSTRKFAFGLMQKEIENAQKNDRPIWHWNIIDVTEKCQPDRHKPEQPKVQQYISRQLPLKQITPKAFSELKEEDKAKYESVEAYTGCLECPLLPVCKTRLATRPEGDIGGLYKSIDHVINTFKSTNPDIAEAQLMCFSGNAQVLMANGTSKAIENVEIGDQVITHTGSINVVTETFKRHSEGPSFEVPTSWTGFGDTYVTAEHPYFVNGQEWKSTKDLSIFTFDKWGSLTNKGDYLSLPTGYDQSELRYIDYKEHIDQNATITENGKVEFLSTGRLIPSTYELTKEFGWILGYYLAEGYLSKRSYGPNRGFTAVTFSSHVKETDCHVKVTEFAEFCGLTVVNQKKKDGFGHTQTIYSKNLAMLFDVLCGQLSHTKKINSVLMNTNSEFLRGILDGFYDGDGTKRYESQKELTTTSYQLASQLFLIASRFGLTPRIKREPLKSNRKQAYRVRYINDQFEHKQSRTKYKNEGGFNQYRLNNLNECNYSGFVYNIEVEGDHSYIVNGVAVHNCWKPGSLGVIYGRFEDAGNILTLEEAWEQFTGEEAPIDLSLTDLIEQLHRREISFYVGGDWGYRHNYALIATAVMPNGDWWLFETFAMSELELEDQLKYAKIFRDKYRPKRWFMDPAYPGNLKTFTKNGMPCKDFTKDIMFGIESVRGMIVNSTGRRRLKVIQSPDKENDILVQGFKMHHFMTDAQGRVTQKPDDEEFADVMDSLRYLGQNLFPPKKHGEKENHADVLAAKEQEMMIQKYLVNQHVTPQASIYQQIVQSSGAIPSPEKGWSKNKRVFFDFGGPDE